MADLRFGVCNDELISIEHVASGLKCNCICPCCGGRLIARKGKSRNHHFAHYNVADCKHGAESALHILAKNIVAETKEVCVPITPKNIYETQTKKYLCKFEKAYIEQQLSPNIRSDILLETNGRKLNVEIKVTHAVYDSKKYHLFNEEVATIEIDLSGIIDNYSKAIIQEHIRRGYTTNLIFSPKAKNIYAKWWLGEWKEVHHDRGGHSYVKNCCGIDDAYFVAYDARRDHGYMECHECSGFEEYNGSANFLCRGKLGKLNFEKIERIIDIQKEAGILKYAELIDDGKHFIYGSKQ